MNHSARGETLPFAVAYRKQKMSELFIVTTVVVSSICCSVLMDNTSLSTSHASSPRPLPTSDKDCHENWMHEVLIIFRWKAVTLTTDKVHPAPQGGHQLCHYRERALETLC
ncbi:hypothetical protein F2P81_010276 [Scophthalmus maximus]|uniref:Uncharacterized protein n=1 Tax=Scophthalmus maximus TaxID=52904 RepID=A0A6A4T5D6_SCOMX|nr:hypothetical protein F2P81_010276 [Scophthalmus maximus]